MGINESWIPVSSIWIKFKFKTSPGKYIGKTIPINYQIEHPTHIRGKNNYVYSLTTNLNDCFKWSLQNGFGKKWKPDNHDMGGLRHDDDSDEEEGVDEDEDDDDENIDQDDDDEENSDHNF